VLTEVTQLDLAAKQVACRLGEQHLPAVSGCRDPCPTVDVDPNVPLVSHDRLACVQAHPHPDRPLVQRLLAVHCCCERILCSREGDEEGITLRIDLGATVAAKRLAQKAPVFGERLRITVAELV
jgi:hypothetical protein